MPDQNPQSPGTSGTDQNAQTPGIGVPQGSTPSNPSGAYAQPSRGPGRPKDLQRSRTRVRNGIPEHRHPGADYWHPASRRHGRRGMSDAQSEAETQRIHEAAGLGRDGMGGDSATRAMMQSGEDASSDRQGFTDRHPGATAVGRAAGVAGLAAASVMKNLALNAGNLTDAAFSGIRNAMQACLSPNPLSAAGSVMVDSLAKVGDTSREMEEIQRRYGVGNPDGQSLESTLAGRMMLRDQNEVRNGTQRGLASVSSMMSQTGADDVNGMGTDQLQQFANSNATRMNQILRELVEDDAKPSSRRMSKAERKGLMAELKVHRDMNDQIVGRSKEIRSDAKEMAARIGHERQYRNQMAAIKRKEDRAKLQAEAEERFRQMDPWSQVIHTGVGARIALDADGVPVNRGKRTQARGILDAERDRAQRLLDGMRTSKIPDQAEMDALQKRIDSYSEGISRIDAKNKREDDAKEAERARRRAEAEEEKRKQREQDRIDRRRELAVGASDFADPDFDPASYIMRRTGVYDSDRGLDSHLVPQGTFNNPKIRQNLQSANLQWENYARENGIDLSQNPRYVSSKNTEAAMSAKDHMDHVTKQLDHILTASDDDIERYFEGSSRERLEQDLRDLYAAYDADRTEFPVDDIAAGGRGMALIPKDRAQAFQDRLNGLEEKWGLNRYARRPRARDGDGEQSEDVVTDAGPGGPGDGGTDIPRTATSTLPERPAVEPLPASQDGSATEEVSEPEAEPVEAQEAAAGPRIVTMNAGPGDVPIYREGRPLEYYEDTVPTAEGEQTVYRPIDRGTTVQSDELPMYPSDMSGVSPEVLEPASTLSGYEGLPTETVPGPSEAPSGDEGETPPEEGRWSDVPRTSNLIHPGRGNSASNLALNSIGTNLANAGNSKYLVEPEHMRDAMIENFDQATDIMENFKYRGKTGGDGLRAALTDNIYDMANALEKRGADLEGLEIPEIIAAYYENFPKDRAMAIRTANALEFERIYNDRVRETDKRLPDYEYRSPLMQETPAPVEQTTMGGDGVPITTGSMYEDMQEGPSKTRMQLDKLLEDVPGIAEKVDTSKPMSDAELYAQIRANVPKDMANHVLNQLQRIKDGKSYQKYKRGGDPKKQKAHILTSKEKDALSDARADIMREVFGNRLGIKPPEDMDYGSLKEAVANMSDNGQVLKFIGDLNRWDRKAENGQISAEDYRRQVEKLADSL